jgi:hypothetical protein
MKRDWHVQLSASRTVKGTLKDFSDNLDGIARRYALRLSPQTDPEASTWTFLARHLFALSTLISHAFLGVASKKTNTTATFRSLSISHSTAALPPIIRISTSMGHKRKASFSLSPSSVSAISPGRDQSSPFQPLRLPDNHPHSVANGWSHAEPWSLPATTLSEAVPNYLNSRTRKRFRDGRPDEEVIHQHTLSKLFSAQRSHQNALEAEPFDHNQEVSLSSPSSVYPRPESFASLMSAPTQLKQYERPKSQRSLDSFFSTNGGKRTSQSSVAHSLITFSPPAPPPWQATHIPGNTATKQASILTCEDCYAPLLTATYRNAVDVEMMDIDEYDIDNAWECERCRRRVCDTCAVRRESRICLECANPGHGHDNTVESGEKRWVSGIGWM